MFLGTTDSQGLSEVNTTESRSFSHESSERTAAKERFEKKPETAEQQQEREYQENIQSLVEAADQRIKAVELERARKKIVPDVPTVTPSQTHSLQEIKQEYTPNPTTRTGMLKHKLSNWLSRLDGIKDPETVNAILAYFEQTMTTSEHRTESVDPGSVEEFKDKYQQEGWDVWDRSYGGSDTEDGKAKFSLHREVPYKSTSAQAKRVAELLNLPNDPIEVIDRLQRIGFRIDGNTIKYPHSFNELKFFVGLPGVVETLDKLEQLGVKSKNNFLARKDYVDTSADLVEELVTDPSKQDILSDENIAKVQRVKSIINAELPLDYGVIKNLLQVAEDEQSVQLLNAVILNLGDKKVEPHQARNILYLKERGLTSEVLRLLDMGVSIEELAVKSLFDSSWHYQEQENQIISEIEKQVQSPELIALQNDKELLDFVTKASALTNSPIRLADIANYQALQKYPDSVAVLELLKEFGMPVHLNYQHEVSNVNHLLEDKELMQAVTAPDFRNFIRDFRNTIHFSAAVDDLAKLKEIFSDPEKTEKLLSETGQAVVKYFGTLDLNYLESYFELIDTPGGNIMEILQGLEENYGYHLKSVSLTWEVTSIRRLSGDLYEKLLEERTLNYYHQLQETYGYQFQATDAARLYYATYPWYEKEWEFILNEQTAEFVKTVFDNSTDFEYIRAVQEIKPELWPMMRDLADSFDYKAAMHNNGDNFKSNDQPWLEQLLENDQMRETLFSPEKVNLVKSISLVESSYHFRLDNIGWLLDFPYSGEQMAQVITVLKEGLGYYSFNPNDIPVLLSVIEKGYTAEDIKALGELYKKYPYDSGSDWDNKSRNSNYRSRINEIPNLLILKESESEIASCITTIREISKTAGVYLHAVDDAKLVKEIIDSHLLNTIVSLKDEPRLQAFVLNNIEKLLGVSPEKRDLYLVIFKKIDDSPSQEVQRLKDSLLRQLLETDTPLESYQKIESIFIKNNLPTLGKVYKVFEVLYPAETIKSNLGDRSSPVLRSTSARRQTQIIYHDLLKTHIDSANRSLRDYVEILREGEIILNEVETVGVEQLDETQQKKLTYFLNKLNTLLINSSLGVSPEDVSLDMPMLERYQNLRRSLRVRDDQKITERIAEMFVKPAGFENLTQILDRMKQVKQAAHDRNLQFVAEAQGGQLQLKEGDLIKGIDSLYLSNILQNGSVAKEFLGYASQSDMTPFDTDLSYIEPEDLEGGFETAVSNSLATGYGDLMLVIKNRGQFQVTNSSEHHYNPNKLELFRTGIASSKHYGVRTGFPVTEVDCIVIKSSSDAKQAESIYYEIAQNGYYIPVVDVTGKVVFTPDMYAEYRQTFAGLKRFDGEAFDYVPNEPSGIAYEAINEIRSDINADKEKVSQLSSQIFKTVARVLDSRDIHLKDKFDSSMLGAELLDTGSTGRGTNVPGDYDFDLSLRLDARDFEQAAELAGEIKQRFTFSRDESHQEEGGYYQLRVFEVTEIDGVKLDQPMDIDIGFAKKSDLTAYASHDAIQEKLQWIETNISLEAREEVVANVLLAKKVLKEGKAYKKFEDGGFGGIGTENWIMANGGNMLKAFQTFRDAAYENGARVSLETFKQKYKLLDAGFNIKYNNHDNYIMNLKSNGYEAMLNTIEAYLSKQ